MEFYQEEVTDEIASSLVEQLSLLYAANDFSENNAKTILNGMRDDCSRYPDHEELRRAIPKALKKWKGDNANSVENTQTKSKSFSLFDQLQGFQLPVSLEEIKDASSPTERLFAYKKITYLDDLVMDWNEIKPLLLSDIQDEKCGFEILELHKKWFDLSRTSTEYLFLQYQLCEILMNAMISHIKSPGVDSKFLLSLLETWRELFFDIMQRGLYALDLIEWMEKRMVLLLRDMNLTDSPVSLLALVDNRARWFQAWTMLVSKDTLIDLLEKSCLLPDIIKRCSAVPTKVDTDGYMISLSLYLQAVSILAAVLEKTRIVGFPWNLLLQPQAIPLNATDLDNPSPIHCSDLKLSSNPSQENIDKLFDIFRSAISLDARADWKQICYNALSLFPQHRNSMQLSGYGEN